MAQNNQAFTKLLLNWYERNKRDLPWRANREPYLIWLSEIILQQTRVEQGLPYFERFVAKYPSVLELAAATEQEVLSLWQGLGYYSRARNLHHCAITISTDYAGVFPANYEELLKLKGVGAYTAAAIASMAFDVKVPVIDGNVFRVASRIFGIHEDIANPRSRKVFQERLEELIPDDNPGDFNQAIMEFGAMQCVPVKPDCHTCIFKTQCYAYRTNEVKNLPVKAKKGKARERFIHYIVFEHNNVLLFRERKGKDIWQGLHDFYSIEAPAILTEIQLTEELERMLKEIKWELIETTGIHKHILTHRIIFAKFLRVAIYDKTEFNDLSLRFGLHPVNSSVWEVIPKPILITNYLKSKHNLFNSIKINY